MLTEPLISKVGVATVLPNTDNAKVEAVLHPPTVLVQLIVVEPAPSVVTTPDELIVATDVLLEDQTPPVVASVKVSVLPKQTLLLLLDIAATVIGDTTVTVVPALVVLPQAVTVTV